MTKILCLIFAINCFSAGWFWTGMLFLWIVIAKKFCD